MCSQQLANELIHGNAKLLKRRTRLIPPSLTGSQAKRNFVVVPHHHIVIPMDYLISTVNGRRNLSPFYEMHLLFFFSSTPNLMVRSFQHCHSVCTHAVAFTRSLAYIRACIMKSYSPPFYIEHPQLP